jgi:hypothetical protein
LFLNLQVSTVHSLCVGIYNLRSKSLWWWFINTIIDCLDIHFPLFFYLNCFRD